MKKLLRTLSRFFSLPVAANDAVALDDALIVGAMNETPIAKDQEWEQVTPWGKFPNQLGLQVVTPAEGNAMVAAFNSLAGRLGRLFRGVPIYVGHPDVNPEKYPDKRRYGKLDALKVGDDGLLCKPAWNDLGQQNIDQGYYVYPSPVWKFKRQPDGTIKPVELMSIGLTNRPNIGEISPWAKNELEQAAVNDGTRAGALKGWATRRAGGATGAKNKKAVAAKKVMAAKKTAKDPNIDAEEKHIIAKGEASVSRKKASQLKEKARDQAYGKKDLTQTLYAKSLRKEMEKNTVPKSVPALPATPATPSGIKISLPKRGATPPPLPKSTSSGDNSTHIHIHHAASVDHDPYFGYTGNEAPSFYRSRPASARAAAALRLRQSKTAAA